MNVFKARVTKDQFINSYLQIWNGGLNLTNKELEIVIYIVKSYVSLMEANIKEPYLSEMVFGYERTKKLKKDLDCSSQNWGNYKKSLIKKKVLIREDDEIRINPMLMPKTELTFKFELING